MKGGSWSADVARPALDAIHHKRKKLSLERRAKENGGYERFALVFDRDGRIGARFSAAGLFAIAESVVKSVRYECGRRGIPKCS